MVLIDSKTPLTLTLPTTAGGALVPGGISNQQRIVFRSKQGGVDHTITPSGNDTINDTIKNGYVIKAGMPTSFTSAGNTWYTGNA
jgi:hypothetical protein